MAKSLFEMDAAAFRGLIILALHDETNLIIPHIPPSILCHAESKCAAEIRLKGVKWVIFKVQAVHLFLMKGSISLTSLWQKVLHACVLKPVLLCLLYGFLFMCILQTHRCIIQVLHMGTKCLKD